MAIDTPYDLGFFAGVKAQENAMFTTKELQRVIPYPEKDKWGGTSNYKKARSEFMRGWNDSKTNSRS